MVVVVADRNRAVGVGVAAQQGFTLSGRVGATDQEAQEGYFAIDNQTMIVVKPGSDLHNYMRARVGQRVRVTDRAASRESESVQRIQPALSSRRITAPTRLSGVDAPDVSPIVTSPAGSQPVVVISSVCPTGLCRMSSADSSPSGSAM